MPRNLLNPGDEIDAAVISTKPFGLLVRTTTGVPGLVRGATAAVGATVRLRVLDYDATESRFSAELAD